MNTIQILVYLFGAVSCLALIAFAGYSHLIVRIAGNPPGLQLTRLSAIFFVIAFSAAITDAFIIAPSQLVNVEFALWAIGMCGLISGVTLSWRDVTKVHRSTFAQTVAICPCSPYHLIIGALLVFIVLPAWILFLSGPIRPTFDWIDLAGMMICALAFGLFASGSRKFYISLGHARIVAGSRRVLVLRDDRLAVVAWTHLLNTFMEKARPTTGESINKAIKEHYRANPLIFKRCQAGRNENIDTAPILSNIEEIENGDRTNLVFTSFAQLTHNIFKIFSEMTSPSLAGRILLESFEDTKDRYDHTSIPVDILRALPEDMLPEKRYLLLNQTGLEMWLKEITSELAQSRIELGVRKQLHEQVLDSAPIGIVGLDWEERIAFSNPVFARLFRDPNEEKSACIGEHITGVLKTIEFAKTAGFALAKQGDTKALAHTFPEGFSASGEIISCNGAILHLAMHFAPIFDVTENFNGAVILFEDITHLKQTEQRADAINKEWLRDRNTLRELNLHLEEKVTWRTQEIEKLLKQSEEYISQLGHDLRSPLTPVLGLLPLLRERETDAEKRELFDVVIRNVEYMRELVAQTMHLAKLSSPSTEFLISNVDLAKALEEFTERQKALFLANDVSIHNNIDDRIIVAVDDLRLHELFGNLATNAIKYMPNGGPITFDAVDDGEFVTISITDTGIGLTREQTEHIFDDFFRTSYSRHELDLTGLGLSVCKRIVERHGGEIWAESEGLGKGATTRFTIPSNQETLCDDPNPSDIEA